MSTPSIALQLYTIREACKPDFPAALREVARMGYAGVELAGTYGLPAADLKALAADLRLALVSAHVGLEMLENELDQVADYYVALGVKRIVVPWLQAARRQTPADWKKVAESLVAIATRLAQRGLACGYHNHDFEFVRLAEFGQRYALDVILAETASAGVFAELDLGWVGIGGEDPAAYIRQYTGRVPLLHLKDFQPDPKGSERMTDTELGRGLLDIPGVFAAARQAGTEWMIVEMDRPPRAPLESVKACLDHLRSVGLAP